MTTIYTIRETTKKVSGIATGKTRILPAYEILCNGTVVSITTDKAKAEQRAREWTIKNN